MAEQKYLSLAGLERVIDKIDEKLEGKVNVVAGKGLSANDYSDAEKAKLAKVVTDVEGIVAVGGQANVIEKVKVNGTALPVDGEKAVNIDLSEYALKADIVNAMDWKGTVATVADLPTEGQSKGDIYHVTATGGEYAWDGTEWQEMGSIVDLSGYYTKGEVNNLLAGKAESVHGHAISEVTGLQAALDSKLNTADLVAITDAEIDALFA